MKNLYVTPDLELIELIDGDVLMTSGKDTALIETDEKGEAWTPWG